MFFLERQDMSLKYVIAICPIGDRDRDLLKCSWENKYMDSHAHLIEENASGGRQ